MVGNQIQFAVVREDPEAELALIQRLSAKPKVLMIGSGGCTAFAILVRYPGAELTLMEPNPSQIDLIKSKLQVLASADQPARAKAFAIGQERENALTTCGNFESLFKLFRQFLYEFVLDRTQWLTIFEKQFDSTIVSRALASKYWPVAFDLFFSDSLLLAMFGSDAIQHAPSGSYPKYFQTVLERGLRSDFAFNNYFLHHIFLGHYLNRPEALPEYLRLSLPSGDVMVSYKNVTAQDMDSYQQFDLLSFSNIFDWMPEKDVLAIATRTASEMKKGSWLIYRQLNNGMNFRPAFGRDLKFDDAFAAELYEKDRSLFYSSIHIAQKQ